MSWGYRAHAGSGFDSHRRRFVVREVACYTVESRGSREHVIGVHRQQLSPYVNRDEGLV